jgi:Fe-S-cluster-containing dehydrogenase component
MFSGRVRAMPRYGFAIDHRKCIGCHACTVACKMENDVPLGVFRTWVKYIEKGTFPDARRYFSVLRCNHCTDAPCISICPTKALFKRDDGIVDFDGARCIGCKACMQGCPYDALYIDPQALTAAKCNFCAHRVEVDLAPACEIVCPTHAIISGDLNDPTSEIARIVRSEQTTVRAPEQGTGPNVFYIGADGATLDPAAVRQAEAYLWSEIVPDAQTHSRDNGSGPSGNEILAMAGGAITTYNTSHPAMWGWRVSTYLWTKSLASGIVMAALIALGLGHEPAGVLSWAAPAAAFVFVALTGYLLVADLKQPLRFLYIFLKPNPTSWLVWGAWILVAYSAALIGWIWGDIGPPAVFRTLGMAAAVPLAPLAAAYSGWLFNQAEGRDLWQSRLLHVHLVIMAFLGGSGALVLLAPILGATSAVMRVLAVILVASAAAHGLVLLLEFTGKHPTRNAATAAHNLTSGVFARHFWGGVLLAVGVAGGAGAAFLVISSEPLLWVSAAAALAGTWLYEDGWIRAGQSAPLS